MVPIWLASNVKACRSCRAAMKGSQVSAPARLQRIMPAMPPSTINPVGPSRRVAAGPARRARFRRDSFRPKPADRRVRETQRSPVERPDAIINLMARLQRGCGKDKDPEPGVAGDNVNSSNPSRTLCWAVRRDMQAREQHKGRGAEHQREHPLPRGRCQCCTACDRGDDKAHRPPEADSPIIEAFRAGGGEGNCIAERHHADCAISATRLSEIISQKFLADKSPA